MLEFFCDVMAEDRYHLDGYAACLRAVLHQLRDETYHKILPNHDKRLIFKQSPGSDCVVSA
jgi:hypothetical protein